MRCLRIAGAYLALVFVAGFALGVARVLVVAPRIGAVAAEIAEQPLMIAVCWFAAGASVRRLAPGAPRGERALAGGLALAGLLALEIGVVTLVSGEPPTALWEGRDPRALAAWSIALAAFAVFPALVRTARPGADAVSTGDRGERERGLLVRWDVARGFGFVAPEAGGRDRFVHVSDLPRRARPRVGMRVHYAPGVDDAGRPRAEAVRPVGTVGSAVAHLGPLALAFVPLAALGASAVDGRIPWLVPGAVAAASFVAAGLYVLDKAAARAGRQRISENTLHLWALVGGWPGAWCAARMLRHKTRKRSFRIGFSVTVLLNGAVLVWLHTPEGARLAFDVEARLTPLLDSAIEALPAIGDRSPTPRGRSCALG